MTIIPHQFNQINIFQLSEDTVINGKVIPAGYVNATQMCSANNKKLNKYFEHSKTKPFLDALKALHSRRSPSQGERELVIVLVGGSDKDTQGTWVHYHVAMNLAQWISPDFAAWAAVVLAEMLNGNFEALTADAEEAKQGLKQEWEEVRQGGKVTRRKLTDAIKEWYERNPKGTTRPQHAMYSQTTNAIYQALWGMDAKEIEAKLGCGRNESRNHLSADCLAILDRAEYQVMDFIDLDNIKPVDAVKAANLRASRVSI